MNRISISDSSRGVAFALGAYLSWGLLPIYWKALSHVPAFEALAHRIFWSMVVVMAMLAGGRRLSEIKRDLGVLQNRFALAASALVLGANWFVYIWAVGANQVVDASLGYFIAPLVSVVLGMLFLNERLTRWQITAVVLAVIGVMNQVVNYGTFPWVALSLAFTFGFYSLIRKKIQVAPMVGLGIEMLALAPVTGGLILAWWIQGTGSFFMINPATDLLCIGTGVITAIPLLWYTCSVKRLRLSTVGFIQYLLPTCQLLLGTLLYKEPFTQTHLITFGFIWLGLIMFSINSFQTHR